MITFPEHIIFALLQAINCIIYIDNTHRIREFHINVYENVGDYHMSHNATQLNVTVV